MARSALPGQGTAPPVTRVLLVDDHQMFVELIARALGEHDDVEVVGVAGHADDAVAQAIAKQPDVVVVDYGLPGANGVVATTRLREALPDVAVLMLTGHDDHSIVRDAVDAGCSGFLTKDRPADELVAAVRSVRDGKVALDLDALSRLTDREAMPIGRAAKGLTTKEIEVLRLLADGASTREIADRLFISVNTARNHVQRTIRKLGAHSRLEAVAIATRAGLVGRTGGR